MALIDSSTTRTGLTMQAGLDPGEYPTGIRVTDAELASIALTRAAFHGDWNYTISPRHLQSDGQFIFAPLLREFLDEDNSCWTGESQENLECY